jgi:hypothetical protein
MRLNEKKSFRKSSQKDSACGASLNFIRYSLKRELFAGNTTKGSLFLSEFSSLA